MGVGRKWLGRGMAKSVEGGQEELEMVREGWRGDEEVYDTV